MTKYATSTSNGAIQKVDSAGGVVYALLVVILGFAGYLRFRNLGAESLWLDEAVSWSQATAGGLLDIVAATAKDNYPPLHNLILWATISLFGDGEWALRLPSAILGTLNVVAVYWVGTLVGGRIAGLIAALLLALSGFHIWYSQEARMYALLALSATLFAGTSLRLSTKPTPPNTAFAGLAGLALLYSHPYGALTWLSIASAIAAAIVWRPQSGGLTLRRWAILQATIVAGFLPWAFILLRRADAVSHGFWIQYPTPGFVLGQLQTLVSGPYLFVFVGPAIALALIPRSRPRYAGTIPSVAVVAPRTERIALVVAWAIGPLLLGYLASVSSQPILIARYLLGSLPAILILAAIGLSRLATTRLAAAAVLVLTAGVSWFTSSGQEPREDWRNATAFVAGVYRQSVCVVLPGVSAGEAFRYYFREPIDCLAYGFRPEPVDPRKVPSDFVLLIAIGYGGNDVDGVSADMLKGFPEPSWHNDGGARFTRVNVMAVSRNRP